MLIQFPGRDGYVLAAPVATRLHFLDIASPDPDGSLVVWAVYLEVLLGAAERADRDLAARERAQRDLVSFLWSSPAIAVELDRICAWYLGRT